MVFYGTPEGALWNLLKLQCVGHCTTDIGDRSGPSRSHDCGDIRFGVVGFEIGETP